MPDTNSSPPLRAGPDPIDPDAQRKLMEQKRAEWDVITEKRKQMIAVEQAKANERASTDEHRLERDQKAYQEEVQAARTRAIEREEWRQEQHTKREEEEKKRKEAEVQKLMEADEQKRKDAAEAERKEYMMNLHKVATAHKIRDKRELIEDQTDEAIRHLSDAADRSERLLGEDTERSLHHLEAERQRKMSQVRVDDERRRKMVEERARAAVQEAHGEWKKTDDAARHMQNRTDAGQTISAARFQENQAKMRIENERKRDLLLLDEQLDAKLFAIDQETKRLKDEMLKNAGTKKVLIERQEDKKKQEVERRKDNFEKWLKEG